jgi:hypothetical protein
MKNLISRLTMRKGASAFCDHIGGEAVYHYTDKWNTQYLAAFPFYPWSFRVKR